MKFGELKTGEMFILNGETFIKMDDGLFSLQDGEMIIIRNGKAECLTMDMSNETLFNSDDEVEIADY